MHQTKDNPCSFLPPSPSKQTTAGSHLIVPDLFLHNYVSSFHNLHRLTMTWSWLWKKTKETLKKTASN